MDYDWLRTILLRDTPSGAVHFAISVIIIWYGVSGGFWNQLVYYNFKIPQSVPGLIPSSGLQRACCFDTISWYGLPVILTWSTVLMDWKATN